MKRTHSFHFGPSLAWKQNTKLIKAQRLVPDQRAAPGKKITPAIVSQTKWEPTGSGRGGSKPRRHSGAAATGDRRQEGVSFFHLVAGLRAPTGVPSPNPYCSIVKKACKQEPPSVTSEWFEQTNIITRVFMEKCLSSEAERA